jgi:tetratricopeptide (TPR) repeat protein
MGYWRAGHLAQAKTELDEALKHGPNLPIVLEALAQMNLASGDIQAAEDYAKKSYSSTATTPQDMFCSERHLFVGGNLPKHVWSSWMHRNLLLMIRRYALISLRLMLVNGSGEKLRRNSKTL